ncbi:alpha/beta hydrolase [Pseudonocardia sp. DSM 110487]|uniref:alpha/beta fold hydrolase n=1 Tax=Pseudonocardia sp. DSM 110487 TaxID=2865833 RepID=UPI001C69683A|nr:alpha/beta hydrolase [Pseudonocardia sp. DSM 110487]QYN35453.1 alpha/beta hydrolase [Pseudonocardia sp. DSM 110487]
MDHLTVDGIHVEIDGAGPPVVLTHDALTHSEAWDAQVPAWSTDHRVASWDRRGYGHSPRPTTQYSSIDDLAAVVRAVSDGPAALVGCSFGSLITLHCALQHAELVSKLVLVGPILSGLPLSEHFLTRGGRSVPAPDAPDAEHIEYWSAVDPWFVAPSSPAARERLRALLTANPQNLRPPLELERRPETPATAQLGEIRVPTLIVVGELDIPDVHAAAGALEVGIPGATRVVVTGSGHLPHLEVPEAFTGVVHEFLAKD